MAQPLTVKSCSARGFSCRHFETFMGTFHMCEFLQVHMGDQRKRENNKKKTLAQFLFPQRICLKSISKI